MTVCRSRLFKLGEIMAQSKSSEKTKVHRIKANDGGQRPAKTKTKAAVASKATVSKKSVSSKKQLKNSKKTKKQTTKTVRDINQPTKNPLLALSNYFRGAWYELKQVRWPSRSATWGLTIAVLVFSGIFVLLILLLDAGFTLLFEQILR